MQKGDLFREIEALRSQVAKLQADKREDRDARESDEQEKPRESGDATETHEFLDFTGLQPHLEELIHSVELELKEIPAATAVAIFALGVLFGRLLYR